MEAVETLCRFIETSAKDPRVGPLHIALYTAILKCWNEQGSTNPVKIHAYTLKKFAKISAGSTYHRILNDLVDYRYIGYQPSFNPAKGSRFTI